MTLAEPWGVGKTWRVTARDGKDYAVLHGYSFEHIWDRVQDLVESLDKATYTLAYWDGYSITEWDMGDAFTYEAVKNKLRKDGMDV